ncbi:MAG: hypothetical protein AAGH15_28530 [Myxococcota bacterium]
MGPKVDGVPYLIGFNWSILVRASRDRGG